MKKLSGWQKAGLFAGVGCLSIIVVVVAGLAIAVVMARSTIAQLGDPNPTRTERTIALPAPQGAPAGAAATKGTPSRVDGPLRLTINLEDGNFTIRPGPPGAQVHVEGTYAQGLYELIEDRADDAGGRTTIRFRSKAPAWARLLSGIGGGNSATRPELTVVIPTGVPIDLSLRVGQGESRIDLGGLTLTDLGLDVAMGNHNVDFKEPVVRGLRRARLNASMGNVSIDHLGNARAESIDASGSMGNLKVDLGGDWQKDTETDLSLRHSMGELTVNVPTNVRLQAEVSSSQGNADNRSADARETQDPAAPRLRLRVSTSMGDSHISRY
jgi:hypothetical protein